MALVVLGYLAVATAVSYGIWDRYDSVEPDYAFSWLVYGPLLAFHVAVGLLIQRWWGLLLPLGWMTLSLGAEGYDTPVSVLIAFGMPFYWLPSLATGIAAARLARGLPLLPRLARRP